ncbi:MAG TPA: AsnC family transcriptional regulator [Thermoplasmata archaeon]
MELSPTDVAILRCLQSDARLSLREVAKRVGVSTPTVSARLAALERLEIVRGFHAHVDPERLSETALALVVRTRLPATDAVAESIASHAWARRVSVARSGRILVDATIVEPETVDSVLETIGTLPDVAEADHYIAVRTVKEEPRARISDRPVAVLTCHECRGPIRGAPIRARLDGRYHYFCCRSCERLFLERYEDLRGAASGAKPARSRARRRPSRS